MARLRETSVGLGRSNESEEDKIESAESFDEDKREDKEEKKNLKEKRDVDRGGNERSFSAAEITTAKYCSELSLTSSGLRSINSTKRCVLAYSKSPAIEMKTENKDSILVLGLKKRGGSELRGYVWRETKKTCHVIRL